MGTDKEKTENKKIVVKGKMFAIIPIMVLLQMVTIITGFVISFFGSGLDGISNVEEMEVIKIENNIVTVYPGVELDHGESVVNTIKKPFLIPIKEHDRISVRYHIDNPTNMHYVISVRTGEKIFIGYFIIMFVLIIIFILYITFLSIKKQL